jgi:hypothetical protein
MLGFGKQRHANFSRRIKRCSKLIEGKGMITRLIHYSYPTINTSARMAQDPFTLTDALRIYFTILFGVAVCVLAFYYL